MTCSVLTEIKLLRFETLEGDGALTAISSSLCESPKWFNNLKHVTAEAFLAIFKRFVSWRTVSIGLFLSEISSLNEDVLFRRLNFKSLEDFLKIMVYYRNGYLNKQPFLHNEYIILTNLFIDATRADLDANPSAFFFL